MNLEEFKTLTKEQLKAYGDTIPLGKTYNSNNNLLTYKNLNGYWIEPTYNNNPNNKQLTCRSSYGYWSERTYDSNNNLLTCRSSYGFWYEHTYDSNSNELTFKNSDGGGGIVLIKGIEHTLYYDIDSKKYKAGCKSLTYDECIQFYKEFKDEHDDAELFLETIKQHNLTLEK